MVEFGSVVVSSVCACIEGNGVRGSEEGEQDFGRMGQWVSHPSFSTCSDIQIRAQLQIHTQIQYRYNYRFR